MVLLQLLLDVALVDPPESITVYWKAILVIIHFLLTWFFPLSWFFELGLLLSVQASNTKFDAVICDTAQRQE